MVLQVLWTCVHVPCSLQEEFLDLLIGGPAEELDAGLEGGLQHDMDEESGKKEAEEEEEEEEEEEVTRVSYPTHHVRIGSKWGLNHLLNQILWF